MAKTGKGKEVCTGTTQSPQLKKAWVPKDNTDYAHLLENCKKNYDYLKSVLENNDMLRERLMDAHQQKLDEIDQLELMYEDRIKSWEKILVDTSSFFLKARHSVKVMQDLARTNILAQRRDILDQFPGDQEEPNYGDPPFVLDAQRMIPSEALQLYKIASTHLSGIPGISCLRLRIGLDEHVASHIISYMEENGIPYSTENNRVLVGLLNYRVVPT